MMRTQYFSYALSTFKRKTISLSMLAACLSLTACEHDASVSLPQQAADIQSVSPSASSCAEEDALQLALTGRDGFDASRSCLNERSETGLYAELQMVWPNAKTIDIALATQGWGGAKSYMVDVDGQRYHAKYMCIASLEQAMTFATEIRNARRADSWGLGAKIMYDDALQGILVTEFVTPAAADSTQASIVERTEKFAAALADLHKVPVEDTEALSCEWLQGSLSNAWERASQSQGQGLCQPSPSFMRASKQGLSAIFARFAELSIKPVYCHGDAHLGNFIDSEERQVIIDWANLRLGDPVDDLTFLTMFHGADDEATLALARKNEVAGPCVEQRVRLYSILYKLRNHFAWSFHDRAESACGGWKSKEQALLGEIQRALDDEAFVCQMPQGRLSSP